MAKRSTAAVNASPVFADTCRSSRGRVSPVGAGGASSSTMCAFVPPIPNEDTPARRGPPPAGSHGVSAVGTQNGPFAKSISGLGSVKCGTGESWRCSMASTALITPATPEAWLRWPMLAFTDPSAHQPVSPARPKTLVSAATSIGSPSFVPVPWAST
jgi:hypothetical protein